MKIEVNVCSVLFRYRIIFGLTISDGHFIA